MRSVHAWINDDLENCAAPPGLDSRDDGLGAIELLRTGAVVELSLDHDLGDNEQNGRGIDVVDFIAEQQEVHGRDLWPRGGIMLHAANPYGRDAMARPIHRYASCTYVVREDLTSGGKRRFRFEPKPSAGE